MHPCTSNMVCSSKVWWNKAAYPVIISKLISYVLRGIKRAIWRKLVKISDCRVSSFLKALPGFPVSRHNVNNNWQIRGWVQ